MAAETAAEAMEPDEEAIALYGDGLAKMAGSSHGARTMHVYPVTNYSFGQKAGRAAKDATPSATATRLREAYERDGPRRSVDAVMLVNQHNTPHVLLLQSAGCGPGAPATFRLPGGRLRRGEGELEGLQRKLHSKLSPSDASLGGAKEWETGDCLARWHRPAHDAHFYPYLPTHATRPKEARAVYAVQLPEKCKFAVPKSLKLLAVPLFELYGNEKRYGAVVSSIPYLISRFHLNLESKAEE